MVSTQTKIDLQALFANFQTVQTRHLQANQAVEMAKSKLTVTREELLKLVRRQRQLEQIIAKTESEIANAELFDEESGAVVMGSSQGSALDKLVTLLTRQNAAALLLERVNIQIKRQIEGQKKTAIEIEQVLAEQQQSGQALIAADFALQEGQILADPHLAADAREHSLFILRRRFGRSA